MLLSHPAVAQAVVIGQRGSSRGDKRLVGYVVAPSGQRADPALLRSSLLPKACQDYMVPGAIVVLEALPLTPEWQAGPQGAAGAGVLGER